MALIARIAVIALVMAVGPDAVPASAQPSPTGVALVLEADGPVTPALRPYREVPSGTTVSLASDGRLVFLYYASCRTLTVVGGTVTFTSGPAPILKGAATLADVRGQCPKKFKATGAEAAVVMRGGPDTAVALSTTPDFVLVGNRSDDFGSLRIRQAGREVFARPLPGPRFRWPSDAPALAPGAYALELLPRNGDSTPLSVNVEVSPRGAGALTLITVD